MRKTSKEWKKDYKRHKTNKEREPKGGGKFWTEWLKVFGA